MDQASEQNPRERGDDLYTNSSFNLSCSYNSLSVFKLQAYVPRLVALGPYHHFCSELYEMERYKLAIAGRLQK